MPTSFRRRRPRRLAGTSTSRTASHAATDVVVPPPPTLTGTNPLRTPAPGRILVVGRSLAALGTAVAATDEQALTGEDLHGPRRLDAVVLGDDVPAPRAAGLAAAAETAGVPVLRPGRRPILDVGTVNPVGWRRTPTPAIGLLLAHPDRARTWAAVDRVVARIGGGQPGSAQPGSARPGSAQPGGTRTDVQRLVALVPEPWPLVEARGLTVRRLPTEPEARARLLGTLTAVVDDPGLHQATPARAAWVVEVAARGTPVVTVDDPDLAGYVAAPLRSALASTVLADLDDPHLREGASIRQRRAALRHHGAPEVWRELARAAGLTVPRPPTVSVLLATNRPDRIDAALDRAAGQRYPRVEVVVALHGDGFDPDTEARLRARTDRPVEVLRVPGDRTLGEVLNRATDAATGEVVTKLDDDDLYGPDHLDDLTDALRYSGATVVGKGSEFVYLAELDTTVRRFPHGAETANRNLAGGTLMIGRDDLRRIGAWQPTPRAVDQRLLDDVERAGGRLHRTHGHGFVLCRRASGHTWDPPVDYFLEQAVAQWRGLALEAAGITDLHGDLPGDLPDHLPGDLPGDVEVARPAAVA